MKYFEKDTPNYYFWILGKSKSFINGLNKFSQSEIDQIAPENDKKVVRIMRIYKIYKNFRPRMVKENKGEWKFEDFLFWYDQFDDKCYYCGTKQDDVAQFLSSLPELDGFHKRRNRGQILEIDKKHPGKGYNAENCVPACYICNNAKSDIFEAEEFKQYLGKAMADFINSKS